MIHLGIFGGRQDQIDALLEIQRTTSTPSLSAQNCLISRIDAESYEDRLVVDGLLYLLPLSKTTGNGKTSRASLKWIRELRSYSAYCTRKTMRECRHILVGEIAGYLEQITKLDLDMAVRLSEETEWQPVVSLEQSFEDGELIEFPFIKTLIDTSGGERQPKINEVLKFSDISQIVFHEAKTAGRLLHSVKLKSQEQPQLLKDIAHQKIQPQAIDFLVMKEQGQSRLSIPFNLITALVAKQDSVWSLAVAEAWKIRNKNLPSGDFHLRVDTATFEEFVVDTPKTLDTKLHKALLSVEPRCEEITWKAYIDFQSFSLYERPMLINLTSDLAEILAEQLKFTGFKNIVQATSPQALEQSLISCHIPGQRQEQNQPEKSTFPTIVTTKRQQDDIKQRFPSIKSYAIPELEIKAPQNPEQQEAWEKLKKDTDDKINELLIEAEGNPLQAFYLNIAKLFVLYQQDEVSEALLNKIRSTTLEFLKKLPQHLNSELKALNEQKAIKRDTENKISQLNKLSSKLSKESTQQEASIEKLNAQIRRNHELSVELAERAKEALEVKEEFDLVTYSREDLAQKSKKTKQQIDLIQQQTARIKKQISTIPARTAAIQKEISDLEGQKKSIFGTQKADINELNLNLISLSKESQQLETQLSLKSDILNRYKNQLIVLFSQREKTLKKYGELKKIVDASFSEKGQTSRDMNVEVQKDNDELQKILLLHEKNTLKLQPLSKKLRVEQIKFGKLTREVIGQELAFNKEKMEAENFGKKTIEWITNLSRDNDLTEGLADLGKQADAGLGDFSELIESINKLTTLRRFQDTKNSMVATIMETLDMQFSFYHLTDLKKLIAPMIFVGEQMNYPTFTSRLISMFNLNIKKGQIINWDRFFLENLQFNKQIVILDFSQQTSDPEAISKARDFCFKQCLDNFLILLVPDEQLYDAQWFAFRSLALCLPEKDLNTFLINPFFLWLDSIKELGDDRDVAKGPAVLN
ncbi:MAG: hypothetical protein HQ517_06290, partial [SAR324 cluster bacterium]|nr:hypothetical protein [SAR324 cluster bacterium]